MILKIGFEEVNCRLDSALNENSVIVDIVFADGSFVSNNTSAVLGRAILGKMVLGMGV